MSRSPYLGELELVVLLALRRLPGEAYGMTVYDEIVDTAGRDLTAPTVYITLSRLEKKGYVRSRLGEPTDRRGGRAKRFFAMTREGERAVRRSRGPARPPAQSIELKLPLRLATIYNTRVPLWNTKT